MNLQTFQKNAWHTLFTQSINSLFAQNNFEYNGVQVTFEPDNASAFLKPPVNSNGSIVQTLRVKITFSYKETAATIVKPLITLPVLSSGGITLKNTKWCLINTTSPASGWYLRIDKATGKRLLTLNRNASKLITIGPHNNVTTVTFALNGRNGKKKESISLMTFLKALSRDPSFQYEDIITELEDCSIATKAYAAELRRMQNKGLKEPTSNEAATTVLNLIMNRHEDTAWPDPITELQKRLNDNFMRIGSERIPRFKRFSSFACALQEGVTLATPIHTATVNIEAGGSLTDEAVRYLDSDDSVQQITVSFGKNVFTLHKYAPSEAISFEEVCFMLHVYDRFCQGLGTVDDPDEYDNKIIKSIKEYYEDYIDRAIYRYVVAIKKLLNANVSEDIIEYLIQEDFSNIETPLEEIAGHISSNNFYQMLDDTNSLSVFEQGYKLTTTAKNVNNSARDIHPMQYGRVCPYTTPESKQVGLNLALSIMSGVDEYGFITTPLLPFSSGSMGSTPVYLSAIDEMGKVIAPSTVDLEAEWKAHAHDSEYVIPNCRVNGEVKSAFLSSITHQEVSKAQSIGPLVATVPSAERNAGKRLIMSASAQRQALPTWKPERPFVTTGIDALIDIGIVTARTLIEEHLTSVSEDTTLAGDEKLYLVKTRKLADTLEVTLTFSHNGKSYIIKRILQAPTSTSKGALKYRRCARPEHLDGNRRYFALDDIVFYNNDIDLRSTKFNKSNIDFDSYNLDSNKISSHGVAIGANVKVLFKSYAGYSYEDSIVVNEDFLARQGLTVIRTATIKVVLNPNQKVAFDEASLGHQPQLNEHGFPVQGYYVQTGQAILGIATETESTVKYSVETLKTGQSGFIMSCTKTPDHGNTIIRVALGEILPVSLGDKLEGLHGNKGVIGRIVPAAEMPYTEDGDVADIILNTLGVVARLNLGQMVEFTLGAISEVTGEVQILEPFAAQTVEEVTALAEKYGLVEKEIYDGRTGLRFEKKAMLGNMYMLRLTHTNTSKFNATSNCNDNINARTMQPSRGPGGGQRMSELCTWCLMSYDANDTLGTMFTAQSDDPTCKQMLDKAIRRQENTDVPISSSNIEMLQAYFYMLGVNIAVGSEVRLELLTQEFIERIAPAKCTVITTYGQSLTPQNILHDPTLYHGEAPENDRTTLVQLPFHCRMIMPIYLHNSSVLGMIYYAMEDTDGGVSFELKKFTDHALKKLLAGDLYLSKWDTRTIDPLFAQQMKDDYDIDLPSTYEVPLLALRTADSDVSPDQWGIRGVVNMFSRYNVLSSISQPGFENAEKILLFAKNYTLSDFVVTSMIVPPPGYRQISKRDKKMSNPIDSRLSEVVGAIKSVASSTSLVDQTVCENRLYATLEAITLKDMDVDNPSLRKQLSVHATKSSIMRDVLLAKRMSYTGRSVITIGPELEFGQCGAPVSMLTIIFDEHIVAELSANSKQYYLHSLAELLHCEYRSFYKKAIKFLSNSNVGGFRNLCIQGQNISFRDFCNTATEQYNLHHPSTTVVVTNLLQLFDVCYQELIAIIKELLITHIGALNREPSLHKFSVQGFEIIPIEGYAIKLHPLNCHGFNADFDGDQMSLMMPMHPKGIADMRDKMMSVNNMIDPKDGTGIASLNQDMILGLYYATIHKNNVISYDAAPSITMTYYLPHYTGFESPRGKAFGVATKVAEDIFLGLLHIHDIVKCYYDGRTYIAEAGRILINSLLPGAIGFTDHQDTNSLFGEGNYELLVNYVLNKKSINTVTKQIIDYFFLYNLGADETGDTLAAAYNRLMHVGFKVADFSGVTLSIYDFSRLPVKGLIKDMFEHTSTDTSDIDYWYNRGFYTEEAHSDAKINAWSSTTKSMKALLEDEFQKGNSFDRTSNIFMIVDSGARGDIYQLLEMSGVIGVVTNSTGESLETPILTSYMDGLSPSSFLLNAYTSRRQTVTAQLSTAIAGEFSRECIYLNDHIVIRQDDERCDGHSLWIDIKYDSKLDSSCSDKTVVLADEDIDAIPDEVLMSSDLFLFSTDSVREQYRDLCTKIRSLVKAPIFDDDMARLLKMYQQSAFFAKDPEGNFSLVHIDYTMSEESKRMLKYRVMDMTAVSEDPYCKGYASVFASRAAKIAGDIPSKLGNDVVIGEEILSSIETALLPRIPIYTIIGCHSTEGICRCCFGVKYDSHKFPNFGEHVGYQAVQAIGNPITQMILDSHKSEYTNEESAKDKLDRILSADSSAGIASESVLHQLPFATQDGLHLSIELLDNSYFLTLSDDSGKAIQVVSTDSLQGLNYLNGDILPKGAKLTKVPTEAYDKWLYYAPTEIVQLDVWGSLCECFKKESILARNFEVFARSLTEFGTAEVTDMPNGIVKGSVYSINRLRKLNIPFKAAFMSRAHALTRGDKVLAGVAFADPVKNICDAVLRGVADNPSSNVGVMLLGTYKPLTYKRYTHSVINDAINTPTEVITTAVDASPKAATPVDTTPEVSKETADPITDQLLSQLDALDDKDMPIQMSDYIEDDNLVSNDSTLSGTNFFTED